MIKLFIIDKIKKYDKYLLFGLISNVCKHIIKCPKEDVKQSSFDYWERLNINLVTENIDQDTKDKIEAAYNRAWQNRDFEINKFWSRAAYFWTFIAVIFAVYFALLTFNSKVNETILTEIKVNFPHLELYIICVGIIFSFAWRYVIKGSKRWQENWEIHITFLEDNITGPLYKTVFRTGKFYSVSKINLILSNVIIFIWIVILYTYLGRINALPSFHKSINYMVLLPILLTIYIVFQFMFGYGRTNLENEKFVDLK